MLGSLGALSPFLDAGDANETGGVACRKPLTALGTGQKSVGVSAAESTNSAFWMLSFCSKSKRCRIASRLLLFNTP